MNTITTLAAVRNTPAPRWWDDQSEPVRAVLDLADLRDNATPEIHKRILALLCPAHADVIAELADDLMWVDRLKSQTPCEVLSDYHGQPVHGLYLDVAAERLADELAVSVTTRAQLVASLIEAGAR